ncbi:MAG: dienelactone hydrolase family protein [Alphaproteobacteria bacterium]
MSGTEIEINGPDGPFMGYLAKPSASNAPAVVVIQEIFGVNGVMRGICDDLAAKGFVALCPDLFWRIEPRIQLTDKSEAEWKRAFELFGLFDPDSGVKDIQATITHLRSVDGANGKVGAVGYCLGGLMAYLTSTRTDVDASVGYYGVGIQDRLDEQTKISKPLMLHVAELDQFVPAEAQAKMKEGLSGNDKVTLHHYAGLDHAFARKGGDHYDEAGATQADARTESFLKTHLG